MGITLSYAYAQHTKTKPAQRKDPCANAQTQLDLNECRCGQYQEADAELNRTYQKLLAAGAKNPAFTDKLKASERAWIAFRDAQLDAIYPAKDNPQLAYGSVFTMCYCLAEEELTAERTKQLQRMLASHEGDACGWNNHEPF